MNLSRSTLEASLFLGFLFLFCYLRLIELQRQVGQRQPTMFVLPFFLLIFLTFAKSVPRHQVDILGSSEMNEAILEVVSGNGGAVKDKLHSPILHYAAKIRWDAV
jgi:uncharacterized membrane protein YbaN (DUF454 family)